MISRWEYFQRAVGLKGGRFRQTGIFGSNIIVGTVLGIISGKYIFEEPLQRYWAEKRAAEAAALNGDTSSGGSAGGSGSAEKGKGAAVASKSANSGS